MSTRISSVLLAAISFVAISVIARAQDTGLITGTVTDESGAVIPNVTITITNKATSTARSVTSNSEGLYSAPALLAGDYNVRAEMQGFRTLERDATVQAGTSTTVNLSMSLGATREVVTVEAATAQINYDSHTVAGVVTRENVEDIPLNGRNMLQLATLEPGVTSTPASVGVFNSQFTLSVLGTASRTYVTVDGGSIVDNVEGNTAMNLSNEVVQEFQTAQVNFDLGTGITSTGAINIVTRSGSNDFHGSGYFFYRDHNMASYPGLARSTLDPSPFFARRNPGGWFSGPIIKDKLFFFFNYEYTNQVQAIQVQPDLPSIRGLEDVYSSPYVQKSLTARFDYRLSNKHTLFLRYSHDGNNGFGPQGTGAPEPSYWTNQINWADQGVFGVTSVLTPTLVNDLRFAEFYWERVNTLPSQAQCAAPCVGWDIPGGLAFVGSSNFSFGNNPITPQIGNQHRYQYMDTLSWQKGNHRFKFGGQFYEDESPIAWGFCTPACEGTISPEYVRSVLPAGVVSTYFPTLPTKITSNADLLNVPIYSLQASASGGIGLGSANNPGPYQKAGFENYRPDVFVMDTWKVSPRFTLNLGLQYERESGLFNSDIPKPAFLAPIYGSNLNPTRPNNVELSPSVGFAWSVGKDNKTVIRGGGGIYWDTQAQYQRYRDRSAITPLGNGRLTVSSNVLLNTFPGIVEVLPGVGLKPLPVGAPVPTATLTNLTLGQFIQLLNQQIPALIQKFSPTQQSSGPIAVSAIDVLKSSAELYPLNYPLPRSYQTSIGVQRDLGHDMVLTADYSRKITTQQQIGEEDQNHYNAFVNGVRSPVIPACPTPTYTPGVECSNGPITFWTGGGRGDYDGLLVKLNKRFSRHYQFQASYAFQRLDTIGTLFNLNNYFQSYGPALAHNNLNIAGIGRLPWGFQLSVNSSIISRTPFLPLVPGGDLTGTGANATSSQSSILPGLTYNCFNAGCGKGTLTSAVASWNATYAGKTYPNGNPIPTLVLPSDYQFGDPTFSQNFRLTKAFTLKERYRFEVFGEAFNAFNIANLNNYGTAIDTLAPGCSLTAPGSAFTTCPTQTYKFGKPTQRTVQTFGQNGPRAIQVGGRFTF
jgi:hypothetical protein